MRKRKMQTAITFSLVIAVTALFVIRVFAAAPPDVVQEATDTATQGEAVTVVMAEAAADAAASLPTSTPHVAEYIPDVSGIEETYISDEAYSACIRYGDEYNIAPELLMAVIERESRGILMLSTVRMPGLCRCRKNGIMTGWSGSVSWICLIRIRIFILEQIFSQKFLEKMMMYISCLWLIIWGTKLHTDTTIKGLSASMRGKSRSGLTIYRYCIHTEV